MSMRLQFGFLMLLSSAAIGWAVDSGPTTESAVAAEQQAARALLANDADGVGRPLADDWIVVSTYGGVADKTGFLGVIKSGDFVRKQAVL